MDKVYWWFGMKYALSADGRGLLKYFAPNNFYHIHSDELTRHEKRSHKFLTKLKGVLRYCK